MSVILQRSAYALEAGSRLLASGSRAGVAFGGTLASWTVRELRRAVRAVREPTGGGPNDVCPVCGRPIRVFRALIMMVWLQPHPQELVQACRLQNRTAHSAAELRQALERRRREGPKTSTQELAYLEERLRQGRDALKRLT